jgi:hypothetical protein
MGAAPVGQLVVLGQGWSLKRALFSATHHPCLGSWRALQYSAAGGKESVIRQALDQLNHQIPLLDYLQAHHWQSMGRLSRGRWMGLCPLHQDQKPSFVVDASKNLFYCYGCGRGGDVIRFAELNHQVRFPQALGLLCHGVVWLRCCTKPPVSTACSCNATPKRLPICTNAESGHQK